MPAIQQIKDELSDITTLQFISSAFTEASAARIKKIRAAFEQNKEFYTDISRLYHLVRKCQEQAAKTAAKSRKHPQPVPEPKVLSVALTSNQRFYGNINVTIMRAFFTETAKLAKTDRLIIGKTGNDLAVSLGRDIKFDKLLFAKESPDSEEVRKFLEYCKPYDTVYFFYPKFLSLMTQTAGIIDITQAQSEEQVTEEEIKNLFEPELGKIVEFFTRQVRALLFLRVVLEADLSRTAARLLSMSAAEERSEQLAKEKKRELQKVLASIINRQLLETFAGMTKWKTH